MIANIYVALSTVRSVPLFWFVRQDLCNSLHNSFFLHAIYFPTLVCRWWYDICGSF